MNDREIMCMYIKNSSTCNKFHLSQLIISFVVMNHAKDVRLEEVVYGRGPWRITWNSTISDAMAQNALLKVSFLVAPIISDFFGLRSTLVFLSNFITLLKLSILIMEKSKKKRMSN